MSMLSCVGCLSPQSRLQKSRLINTFFQDGKNLPRHLVRELREQFLYEADKHRELYDERDVAKVATDDWTVERFLLVHGYEEGKALQVLTKAMQWRKLENINDLNEDMFPQEYFRAGLMVLYGQDRHNGQVMIIRANIHKKDGRWYHVVSRFAAFMAERADRANHGQGLTVVVDCRQMKPCSLDIGALDSLLGMFRYRYPRLVTIVVVHKLPRSIFKAAEKIVKEWIRKHEIQRFQFTQCSNKLFKIIAPEQLPNFLGGSNTAPYREVPERGSSAEIVGRQNRIPDNYIRHFKAHYQKMINQMDEN